MIGLAFKFDLGRYHATPWRSNVNEATVEWPPSPWRILRALIAAAHTDLTLTEHRDRGLGVVATLARAPSPAFDLPPSNPAHTRHYFPDLKAPFVPTSKVLDGFIAVDPSATLTVWWDVSITDQDLASLERVAEAVRYLGRSESLCASSVVTEETSSSMLVRPVVAGEDLADRDVTYLLCPAPGLEDPVTALSTTPDEARGARLRLPSGARRVPYSIEIPAPPDPPPVPFRRPTLAVYRLSGGNRPGMKRAVVVGSATRGLIQTRHDGRNRADRSATFSGHGGPGKRQDQHRHAHYLALPDEDGRRIGRVVIWAPEGFGEREVATLAQPGLKLRLRGNPKPIPLSLAALSQAASLLLPDLLGPSRRWRSLTPFGLVRHPKRRGGQMIHTPAEQIRSELAHRGFPEPRSGENGVRLIKGPWLEFDRSRPGQRRIEAPRAVGVEIAFAEPIQGPVALGALSHFGLGLFGPKTE